MATKPINGAGQAIVAASAMFAAPWLGLYFALRNQPGAGLVAMALGVIAIVAGLVFGSDPSSFAASLPTLGISVILVAFEASRKSPSLIGLVPLGLIGMVAIYIPVMCAYPSYFAGLFSLINTAETLEEVRWLLILSACFWGVGSTGFFGHTNDLEERLQRIVPNPTELDVPTPFLVLGVGGYLTLVLFTGVGQLAESRLPEGVANIVSSFTCVYYVAFYAHAFVMFRSRRVVLWKVAWILGMLVLDLISGSKGRFFTSTILPLAVTYALAVGSISRRTLLVFAAVVVIAITVVFPILVNYRNDLSTGRAQVDNAASGLQEASARFEDDYVEKLMVPIIGSNTAEQVLAISSIVYFRPTRPWQDFVSRLLLFWVPRGVWPEKPLALSGNEIGRESGRLNEGDQSTSVLITSPGELYLYFGMFGSALLVVSAFALRLVERLFVGDPGRGAIQCGVWVFFAKESAQFMGGLYAAQLTGLLQELLVLWMALLVSRWWWLSTKKSSGVSDLAV